MQGKIALEEHFAIPDTLQDSKGYLPDHLWPELESRILDIHERRLGEMDRHGVQMMLLSLNAPAIQAIANARKASEIARRANDFLAREVAKRPDRFQGLAALALQDSKGFLPEQLWPELESRILDIQERRLAEMDRHGVQMMILSLNAPAIQAIPDARKATDIARRANDFLAREVAKRPERFQALAALAMQDPDAATRELQR
ncbi:MAG TPA: hypothetical protein VE325_08890, partial [Burkholderiales bacterium]|nr:hypothetical protein [Burkholderiales bacterium]